MLDGRLESLVPEGAVQEKAIHGRISSFAVPSYQMRRVRARSTNRSLFKVLASQDGQLHCGNWNFEGLVAIGHKAMPLGPRRSTCAGSQTLPVQAKDVQDDVTIGKR